MFDADELLGRIEDAAKRYIAAGGDEPFSVNLHPKQYNELLAQLGLPLHVAGVETTVRGFNLKQKSCIPDGKIVLAPTRMIDSPYPPDLQPIRADDKDAALLAHATRVASERLEREAVEKFFGGFGRFRGSFAGGTITADTVPEALSTVLNVVERYKETTGDYPEQVKVGPELHEQIMNSMSAEGIPRICITTIKVRGCEIVEDVTLPACSVICGGHVSTS